MQVIKRDGRKEDFDFSKIDRLDDYATRGLSVDKALLKRQIKFMVYDGMTTGDIFKAQMIAASGLISVEHPEFTQVAARYLLADLMKRANGFSGYRPLAEVIKDGVKQSNLDFALLSFDLERLDKEIEIDRDMKLDYVGLQNLADRYFVKSYSGQLLELPQHFFMRVAMGLAIKEDDKNARAVEFYHQLSNLDYMSSTPTLFNSGTTHSQLASCYVKRTADTISAASGDHPANSIFGGIEESANLSKYAGGIGEDWTPVRSSGSYIKSTRGTSSGVVPYLKIVSDVMVAVNQGGKRKGSLCAYLEPWHADFWEFCELRKEFGSEYQRAHDLSTSAWVPDLLMKRKNDPDAMWSFFDPHECPELMDTWGDEFESVYKRLEEEGKFKRQVKAVELWHHMLANLYETGHPWINFKDTHNRYNQNDHRGVIHSSNLCTEISLITNKDEVAVCNLGSVNLAKHIKPDGTIDFEKLARTVKTAMRMLDNVIDINFYPSSRAKVSNLKHRPVGLGIMGFNEVLVMMGLRYDSQEAVDIDELFTAFISLQAIKASSELAKERGSFSSFEGSKWSKGILPIDQRAVKGSAIDNPMIAKLCDEAREAARSGMRNSAVMALAPTETISLICATTPQMQPSVALSTIKQNIGGDFSYVDPCVKHGRLDLIANCYEPHMPEWRVRHTAVQQPWTDQAISLTIHAPDNMLGRDMDRIYTMAHDLECKGTYYFKPRSANKSAKTTTENEPEPRVCSIDAGPDCEACQ